MMYVRQARLLGVPRGRSGGSRRRWKDAEKKRREAKRMRKTGEGEGGLAGGDAAEGGAFAYTLRIIYWRWIYT